MNTITTMLLLIPLCVGIYTYILCFLIYHLYDYLNNLIFSNYRRRKQRAEKAERYEDFKINGIYKEGLQGIQIVDDRITTVHNTTLYHRLTLTVYPDSELYEYLSEMRNSKNKEITFSFYDNFIENLRIQDYHTARSNFVLINRK